MATARVDGVDLYYELHGPADADVVVLSNGILMSTASWAFQTPVLSRRHRVLLYDCRGMWQSDHPPGPYTMQRHADDLAGLLDVIDVPSAHIGGISYGAELSMEFALRFPERTRSLVLSSAVARVGARLRATISSWLEAVKRSDPELFYAVTVPTNFSSAWIEANGAALDQARERYRQIDYPALGELIRAFLDFDVSSRLPQTEAPALVVVGEEDSLKPRAYAEEIAAGIPDASLAVVPGAGHAVIWEEPRLFNALVLGFLDQIP